MSISDADDGAERDARAANILPLDMVPDDLDPLGEGVLMAHQVAWISDRSQVKVCAKGRRTGITFAEALDSTLIAVTNSAQGGQSTYYIGDTKEKGLEFISTCAKFAKVIAAELLTINEFVFEDRREDGGSKYIAGFRIRFASGNQIVALSSRPENLRGLQGRVVIDEAAFHKDVRDVLDAAVALLIWGGAIRVISTHNGDQNPFNELVRECLTGGVPYKLHCITFNDAVRNGLYRKSCEKAGDTPSWRGLRAWIKLVRGAYGNRKAAMLQELDVIPAASADAVLPLTVIESNTRPEYLVKRWTPAAADFVDWPEDRRRANMAEWIKVHVLPELAKLPPDARIDLGQDFAMRQDKSSIAVGYTDQVLKRRVPLMVELAQCPYDQQKQVLFGIIRSVRFGSAVLDANGNGMVLAQEARQAFGAERIIELIASDAHLATVMPLFVDAFVARAMLIPADRDVRDDLRLLQTIRGVARIPSQIRTKGTDGKGRHGDGAVALINFFTATLQEVTPVEFAAGGSRIGAQALPDAYRVPDIVNLDDGFGTVGGGFDFIGFGHG